MKGDELWGRYHTRISKNSFSQPATVIGERCNTLLQLSIRWARVYQPKSNEGRPCALSPPQTVSKEQFLKFQETEKT